MVLKMARNGDDLAAHGQFTEQPAHQAIVEIPLEPIVQDNETLQDKGERVGGKLGPKLMVEKLAGSGVYYRAFVKSSKPDRVLLYFPPDKEAQKWEWVYKASSRIHRGTVSGRCSWKYQGEGAWKVQVKPNKKKGASRPKGCKKQRVPMQAEGCNAAAQKLDSSACALHPGPTEAPSKESGNASGSCSSLQAEISIGARIGSRDEENPIAAWFHRHSALCAQHELRKRRPDLSLDCKHASPVAQLLFTPAPFVQYSQSALPEQPSNVLSSCGSMDHLVDDAARLSSVGGAERREKTEIELAQAGTCSPHDFDDGSHSTQSLRNSLGAGHAVGTSPQAESVPSPLSPAAEAVRAGAQLSPCQGRKDGDLPETSSFANDSSDTATMYGNDLGSFACVAMKGGVDPASPGGQRRLCS